VKWEYAPAGLVRSGGLFRPPHLCLLRPGGFTAFITTNSIKDGDIRKDGLEQVLKQGGAINMAVRGIKWPGRANLVVSLVSLHKGAWGGKCVLDGKVVGEISAYFEDSIDIGEPVSLRENFGQMFEGSKWTGDGFVITPGQAAQIVEDDPDSAEVVKLLINGDELNNHPLQEPPRRTVYFSDWPLSRAEQFVGAINWVVENVKAEREKHAEPALRKRWWLFKRPTTELYARLRELKTKHTDATDAGTSTPSSNPPCMKSGRANTAVR
jgi:hypothetical protein